MEGRICLEERMIGCFGSIGSMNAHVRKLAMKKLLLTSVAALFLATGTAHAECFGPELVEHWCSEKWSCGLKWIGDEPAMVHPEDIPKLIRAFKIMKRSPKTNCDFLQCLEDRANGKVKHCYENDKRWR